MKEVGCTIHKTIRLLHILWVNTGISDVLCLRLLAWLSDWKVENCIFSRSMKGKRNGGDEVNKRVTVGQILLLKFSYFLIRYSDILCVCVCISLSLSLTHTHTHARTQNMCSPLYGKLGLLAELCHPPSRSLCSTTEVRASHRLIFNLDQNYYTANILTTFFWNFLCL